MFKNAREHFQELINKYNNHLVRLSKKRSRAGLYEFLEEEFSKVLCGAKVLTVGSGGDVSSLLSEFAKLNDFHVVSFDIDKDRSPDILGDVCTDSLDSSCYDVVVLCEVLEHLHSPRIALDNIFAALKPEGKLVLSTPFCLPIHDRPNDYFRFTRYGLALILSKFSDVSIKERNSYFETIDVLWMRLLMERPEKALCLSQIVLPIVFYLKRPITIFLNSLVKTDGITTGYIATAVKRT